MRKRALALVTAVAVAVGVAVSAQAATSPVAKKCPLSTTVAAKLKLKVLGRTQSYVTFSNGLGLDGSRRTCTYRTASGSSVTVILTAGAQVLGFVDAQEAAAESNTGYQNTRTHARAVVPVFGSGNDGWA